MNPTLADVVNREWVKRYGGDPTDDAKALENRVVQLALDRSWLFNANARTCSRRNVTA